MRPAIAALWAAFLLSAPAIAQDAPAPHLAGSPNIWTASNQQPTCSATDGAAITINMVRCPASNAASPSAYSVTLSGNLHKFVNPPTIPDGQTLVFYITEGGAGGFSPEWDSAYGFPGLLWPDLSSLAPGQTAMVVCHSHPAGSLNCELAMLNVSQFNPRAFSDLAVWLDPSDHTTTFNAANCTGANVTTSGTVILSIGDKSGNGFCFNATGTVTLMSASGSWYLLFNGSSHLTAATGPGSVNPNVLGDGQAVMTATIGVYYPSNTANQFIFWIGTNTSGTNARFASGFNVNGSTGQGTGIVARAPDSGAAGVLQQGTTTGLVATPIAQNDNVVLPSAAAFELISNNLFADVFGFLTNSSFDATTNAAVYVGYNGTTSVANLTRLYQLVLRQPSSAPSILTQEQTAWFICAKEGSTC